METFKEFILNEFVLSNYNVLGVILNDVCFLKSDEHDDYWLVAEGYRWYEKQEELYQGVYVKFGLEYPLFEKNTSLLILHDRESASLEPYRLIDIENNPLYFKKYVLCYTNDSFEELAAMLQDSSVADLAMEDGMFDRMLKETDLGAASLLYCIMHKLPFVSVKGQNADRDNQNISFRKKSNADELTNFLDSLPDDENGIHDAIDNLIKVVDNEQNEDKKDFFVEF